MTFALIVSAAMALAYALTRWQETETTAARWKLYALRDRLRWMAIERTHAIPEKLFGELDRSITALCGACQLRIVSLWMCAFAFMFAARDRNVDNGARELLNELEQPRYAEVKEVFEAAALQVVRILIWRHLLLLVLVTPTVLGLFFVLWCFVRIAKRAVAVPLQDPASRFAPRGLAA